MIVLVLLVVVFVGGVVWQFVETRHAVATTSIVSRYSPEQCIQLINAAFGGGARAILWTDVSGAGTINKRRRGARGGITMSINVEPLPSGGTRVDMWASQYVQYLGVLANFAGVVNRRKKAIGRMLAEPDDRSLVAEANAQAGYE